jgi:hypothetical protein
MTGNNKLVRSRDASAPELCQAIAKNPPERREAERRKAQCVLEPRHTRRRCRLKVRGRGSGSSGSRSPLGAPPRRLRRKSMPPLSPGRVSRDAADEGVTSAMHRGYSEAPRGPVVVPAEAMPEPPGSGVTSPARENRTRPVNRPSPVTSLKRASDADITEMVTNVKACLRYGNYGDRELSCMPKGNIGIRKLNGSVKTTRFQTP